MRLRLALGNLLPISHHAPAPRLASPRVNPGAYGDATMTKDFLFGASDPVLRNTVDLVGWAYQMLIGQLAETDTGEWHVKIEAARDEVINYLKNLALDKHPWYEALSYDQQNEIVSVAIAAIEKGFGTLIGASRDINEERDQAE